MNRDEIVVELFRLQDKKYAAFHAKLIPTVETDRIIGVRTPELRTFARKLVKDEDIAFPGNTLLLIKERYQESVQCFFRAGSEQVISRVFCVTNCGKN